MNKTRATIAQCLFALFLKTNELVWRAKEALQRTEAAHWPQVCGKTGIRGDGICFPSGIDRAEANHNFLRDSP
jgi:hypothetical protein